MPKYFASEGDSITPYNPFYDNLPSLPSAPPVSSIYNTVSKYVTPADVANVAIAFGGPKVQALAYPVRRLIGMYDNNRDKSGYIRGSHFSKRMKARRVASYNRYSGMYDKYRHLKWRYDWTRRLNPSMSRYRAFHKTYYS